MNMKQIISLTFFCSYIISFLVILDIILRKVIKSSKICMRLRLTGEWNWRSVFSTENSWSMQKFDISVALGIPYQQTVNFGFLQIKKSYSTLWNGKAKVYPLYSVYVCKLRAWQNLKGIISIIGASNSEKFYLHVFICTQSTSIKEQPKIFAEYDFSFQNLFFLPVFFHYFFSLRDKVGNSSIALS